MDRKLLPRVTFWTGTWDPEREAISKQIDILRRSQGTRAPVVAFSPGNSTVFPPRDGVWCLSAQRWATFWALAALIEPRGDVTHAFGSIDSWHLLRSLGRRPLLFTAVIRGEGLETYLYDRVRLFVAESEAIAVSLRAAGIGDDRIRVIYPGVDLVRFRPAAVPSDTPFRILFASSPADPAEFDDRGIPLLIELARRQPDVEVAVLWRLWGDVDGARRRLEALHPPANFKIEHRGGRDMAEVYAGVHATACFFRDGFGKSCPNSIIESLACGRPALVTDTCGIAPLIAEHKAGISTARSVQAISDGLEQLRADLEQRRIGARRLAERYFGLEGFVGNYARVYADLAG